MPRGSNFHRPYPPEFRREAVELVRRSGRPLREIAVDLGVSTETLRMWVRQVDVDGGRREGLTSEERAELRELRRKVRTLEQEREILKKAAAISTRQRNAALRVAAGVLNARVSRGRAFSLAAIASS
jgi:transposase